MPPEYALDRPVGGIGDRKLLQQLVSQPVQVPAPDAVEAADHPDVLASGQQFVDGGDLAGEAHVAAHHVGFAQDVVAGDGGRPAGRLVSVAIIRTVVVLPAPLGPSSPSTVPGGTAKLTPSTAVFVDRTS